MVVRTAVYFVVAGIELGTEVDTAEVDIGAGTAADIAVDAEAAAEADY